MPRKKKPSEEERILEEVSSGLESVIDGLTFVVNPSTNPVILQAIEDLKKLAVSAKFKVLVNGNRSAKFKLWRVTHRRATDTGPAYGEPGFENRSFSIFSSQTFVISVSRPLRAELLLLPFADLPDATQDLFSVYSTASLFNPGKPHGHQSINGSSD